MFGKGFQTWEYSPVYAIRSYAYLLLHTLPMRLYCAIFTPNTVSMLLKVHDVNISLLQNSEELLNKNTVRSRKFVVL